MRQIIAMFDEYQSRENAKHVLRAMKENARQGFYNGSPVPLGYVAQAVEKRGHRIKKRLAIDPVEAETVKRIFTLYAEGDGTGPMGVKTIAKTLNNDGFRTRKGARFGLATIHDLFQVIQHECAEDGHGQNRDYQHASGRAYNHIDDAAHHQNNDADHQPLAQTRDIAFDDR